VTTPTLHLLCGLPGSSETTLAKRLEADLPALRLTEDEWMARLFRSEVAHDEAIRGRVEAVQWDLAVRAIRLGIPVVLDWGVWTREERDDFRSRAAALTIPLRLHFLDVPFPELVRRLEHRNAALPPETFRISIDDLREYIRWFQPPTPDELA
jgi:predicted kinase